jgi:folate-binding protein YgfZ
VLWDALIYPYGGGERSYLIEVDKDEIEDFMRHLKRHKLRSKVTIRDAREEWRIWNVWQDGSFSSWQCRGSDEKKKRFIVASDPRHKALGSRILSRREDDVPSPISLNGESLQEAPLSAYIIRRYLHGIAEGQEEILRGSGLPMESNMDYLNGIDFRKGCYVGQELTIRTQHTGVIRKRILPVQLYNSSSSPPSLSYSPEETFHVKLGMDIKAEGGKRPAGRLLAGVGNVGLALCRLENMTNLRVSAEGGTWKEGTEFAAAADENGDKVKVRAFVPEWLRLKEHEKMEKRARREDPALE